MCETKCVMIKPQTRLQGQQLLEASREGQQRVVRCLHPCIADDESHRSGNFSAIGYGIYNENSFIYT